MSKPITPFAHGVIDYATVGAVAARARNLCFALAGVTAVVAALTDWDTQSERTARRRHRRKPRLRAAA